MEHYMNDTVTSHIISNSTNTFQHKKTNSVYLRVRKFKTPPIFTAQQQLPLKNNNMSSKTKPLINQSKFEPSQYILKTRKIARTIL